MYQVVKSAIISFFPKVFFAVEGNEVKAQPVYGEKYTRRLLWYLLGGTRGGPNRVEILKALRDRPLNANQLAGSVHLDYKTIEHHVRVLEENGLVTTSEKGAYGAVLFLTPRMEEAWPLLEEIWARIGRTKISPANRRD
jgi:DNA-binding transcriptional ArsR family regulator